MWSAAEEDGRRCGEREAATYRIGAEELQLVRHDLQVT